MTEQEMNEYMALKEIHKRRKLKLDEGNRAMELRAIHCLWLGSLGIKIIDQVDPWNKRYKSWFKSVVQGK